MFPDHLHEEGDSDVTETFNAGKDSNTPAALNPNLHLVGISAPSCWILSGSHFSLNATLKYNRHYAWKRDREHDGKGIIWYL